jgi:guanylate kinase
VRSSACPCTRSCRRCSALALVAVVFGPGGVGKGTLVARLVESDPRLWLSRSWTTRPRRPHEAEDAYVFVDRETFVDAMERGGFLETNEFAANGHLYGTPWPHPPDAALDVVLEIDLNGARQVKARLPDAVAILVEPPSRDELEQRLRGRGDAPDQVARRLALADVEVAEGRGLADHVVVNDDLDGAVAEVARILDAHRRTTPWEQ